MASFAEEEDEHEESFRWYRPNSRRPGLRDRRALRCLPPIATASSVGPDGKVVWPSSRSPSGSPSSSACFERHGLTNVVFSKTPPSPLAHAQTCLQLLGHHWVLPDVGSAMRSCKRPSSSANAIYACRRFRHSGVSPPSEKSTSKVRRLDVIEKSALYLLRRHKTNFLISRIPTHLTADGLGHPLPTSTSAFGNYGYEATIYASLHLSGNMGAALSKRMTLRSRRVHSTDRMGSEKLSFQASC